MMCALIMFEAIFYSYGQQADTFCPLLSALLDKNNSYGRNYVGRWALGAHGNKWAVESTRRATARRFRRKQQRNATPRPTCKGPWKSNGSTNTCTTKSPP